MTVSPYVPLLVGAVLLFGYLALKSLLPPTIRRALPLLLILIGGASYIAQEYVFSKGPDDHGAHLAASATLFKERPSEGVYRPLTIKLLDYQNDPTATGSGTYHFSYEYGGEHGKILCHYDTSSRRFDHDEVVPDN